MAEMFKCSIEMCNFEAAADRMWNLDRKATSGKLVVVCGRDAREARKRGLHAYRLSETIARDAVHAAERARAHTAREEFFARFGRSRLADAFKAAASAPSAAS